MKLFIFDMGGVVVDAPEVMSDIAKLFGMTRGEFLQRCKFDRSAHGKSAADLDIHKADILTLLSNGQIGIAQFWQELYERTGTRVNADYLHILFNCVLKSDVAAIIKELRKKWRVVCGTNTIESHYRVHIERGDYALFDKTYASNVIGASKPDEEFWRRILRGERAEPRDAFFTDDNAENCEAAKRLGIFTHQFSDAKNLRGAIEDFLNAK